MKFFAVRPQKARRRKAAKVALYTVAFSKEELRLHDSSFGGFCKTDCEYSSNCNEECNAKGEYGRLLFIWNHAGYLIRNFRNWQHKLNSDRYGHISIPKAIIRHKVLLSAVESSLLNDDLSEVFEPLYRNPDGRVFR